MIKSITLSNFFSFAEKQTVELDPYVNILIGINGSGKSNFIKAIELLSRGIEEGGMETVAKEWWGWGNVKNHKFHNDKISIELIFTFDGESTFDTFEKYKKSDWTYQLKALSYEDYSGGTVPTHEIISFELQGEQQLFDYKYDDRRLFTHHLTFKHKAIGKLRSQIEKIIVYKDIDANLIRKRTTRYTKDDIRLTPSAENIAGLLYHLHIHHPEYDRVKQLLKEVNPYFGDISFSPDGSDAIKISMAESGLPLEVAIQHMSTGTLKFLALLSILYNPNPNRGKVICLEEPEQGLHPDMIKTVADGIKHAARDNTQMIVTTHSPFLLDFFQVDNILVFEKDKNNETRVTRKTEEDYEGWLDKYTAGDLWMTGKMGGVR